MWPFSCRKEAVVGVQGQPVHVVEVPGLSGPAPRHEAVIERVTIALGKERKGKNRADRIQRLERDLRRHQTLLEIAREAG